MGSILACGTLPAAAPQGAEACRWKQWKQKCQDDSETHNWMTANTKACPKCSKPVEKAGGCNLVVCRCGQVSTSQALYPLKIRLKNITVNSVSGGAFSVTLPSKAVDRLSEGAVVVSMQLEVGQFSHAFS